MPSVRPRWPAAAGLGERATPPRAIAVVASWRDGALHLWGWDGVHTAVPNALHRTFAMWPDNPLRRRSAVLDRHRPAQRRHDAAGDGPPRRRQRRQVAAPVSRRPTGPTRWRGSSPSPASPRSTVSAGLVAPSIHDERGMTVARWIHVDDDTVARRPRRSGRGDAADLRAAEGPTVAEIHAALVDGVARNRLADRGWRPALPLVAAPALAAARSAFRGPGVARPGCSSAAASPTPTSSAALAARLERHERRLRGEPAVVPQVRLVVPDDPLDDWEVRLELVDEVDPGRWCTADDVWDRTPLAVEVAGSDEHIDVLAGEVLALARTVAECVDVATELLTAEEPATLELAVEDAERFLEQAPAELAARGIALLGPELLVRAGIAVRGNATPTDSADHGRRFGREAIVDWRLVVSDDDGPAAITEAELARAERDGATLLHTGHRWVRIDPAAMRRARERLDEHRRDHDVVDAVTLLRLAGRRRGRCRRRADEVVDRRAVGRPPRRAAERGARAGRLRRRAAPVPAARPRLVALPRAARPRRLPRRRHGAGQDADDARPPPRPSRPAPRRVPAVGGPQLGA